MITKDGRDTPIEKLTADNYIVPKGEEKDYHAVIEVVQFDQKTGKRISRPRVQKFGKKIFEAHVMNSLRKQGYTVTILHDPNVWLKEQAAKAEQAKAEAEQAKAQAEQEKFDAAVDKAVSERVDAAVAKALAEQAAKAEQAKAEQSDKKPGPGRPPKDQKEAPEQGSQSK
jgi:hypothetical protein